MTIEDRSYRHYTCDAPLCGAEFDTEHEPSRAPFTTFRVDWGAYKLVLVGTFCEPHADKLRQHLLLLGCEEQQR